MIDDGYPMPRTEDLLQKIGKAKFITSLDCTQGYLQIVLHPDSREFTSFVTHRGQYEYTRTSFGLKTAGNVFQRIVNKILEKHQQYQIVHTLTIIQCFHTNGKSTLNTLMPC